MPGPAAGHEVARTADVEFEAVTMAIRLRTLEVRVVMGVAIEQVVAGHIRDRRPPQDKAAAFIFGETAIVGRGAALDQIVVAVAVEKQARLRSLDKGEAAKVPPRGIVQTHHVAARGRDAAAVNDRSLPRVSEEADRFSRLAALVIDHHSPLQEERATCGADIDQIARLSGIDCLLNCGERFRFRARIGVIAGCRDIVMGLL